MANKRTYSETIPTCSETDYKKTLKEIQNNLLSLQKNIKDLSYSIDAIGQQATHLARSTNTLSNCITNKLHRYRLQAPNNDEYSAKVQKIETKPNLVKVTLDNSSTLNKIDTQLTTTETTQDINSLIEANNYLILKESIPPDPHDYHH